MEKDYVKSLLEEEKYLSKLNEMYNEMISVRRFKRKLDDIEKEITWYVGNEKNMYTPDYRNFFIYAYNNYIPHQDNTIVQSKYKLLLGDYSVKGIPGYLYCLALLGHLRKEEKSFLDVHPIDYKESGQDEIAYFNILHNKVKLLIGFLDRIDNLVAVFINSADINELDYLDDDIKDIDSRAIKYRFMTALHNRDKNMTFKLLGRMRELDEGEDYYFEALSHFISDDYSDCIRYINKIGRDNIDYSAGIAIKLECFSIIGNFPEFIRCLEENIDLKFDFWHIIYLQMSLFLHFDIKEENFEEMNKNLIENIKFSDQIDTYYIGQTYRLVASVIIEGFEILDMIGTLTNIISDFEVPKDKLHRLYILQLTLKLFQEQEDFNKYLDWEYLKDKELSDVRREAELALLKLLIDRNPDKSFENIKAALIMQYRLGDIETFINNINSNFESLLVYISKGEEDAEELIRMAYVEEMLLGNVDLRVKEHIEQRVNADLNGVVDDKKINNLLSTQGKIAYESAEWQFSKSQESDYGWKDAGMISLGFYRILEVELNQKLIIPLLSGIGYETLNNEFMECANLYLGYDKKKYKSKWGTILKSYRAMEETSFEGNGFMLGVLDHFFRAIGSQFEEKDNLASLVRSNLNKVLNVYGIEKFEEGFFEKITNHETRNKFRNPPAHTRYLQYSVACECRDVFREAILQLGDMLING